MMSKLKALLLIVKSANYIVITDTSDLSSVSPLYADKFKDALQQNIDGLSLVQHRHNQMLEKIADSEIGRL